MSWETFAGGAADATNAATGIFSFVDQLVNRQKLYDREDSAVQRRAEDLKKAGLSKTLAAGSPAQTMGTQSPKGLDLKAQAPAMSKIPGEKALMAMQTMKMKADIGVSESQKALNLANASFIDDKKRDLTSQGDLRSSTITRNETLNRLTEVENKFKSHDLGIMEKFGIRSNQQGLITDIRINLEAIREFMAANISNNGPRTPNPLYKTGVKIKAKAAEIIEQLGQGGRDFYNNLLQQMEQSQDDAYITAEEHAESIGANQPGSVWHQ